MPPSAVLAWPEMAPESQTTTHTSDVCKLTIRESDYNRNGPSMSRARELVEKKIEEFMASRAPERDASSAAEPEPEVAADEQAGDEEDVETFVCSSCARAKPASEFSKSQLKKAMLGEPAVSLSCMAEKEKASARKSPPVGSARVATVPTAWKKPLQQQKKQERTGESRGGQGGRA